MLGSGDEALGRALSDVKLQKPTKESKHPSIYVFYDASREAIAPSDPKADVPARKQALLKATGTWLASNKVEVGAVVFMAPTGKPDDYMTGEDIARLAKLDGSAAAKFFGEKLQKPDAPAKPKSDADEKPKTEKTAKKPK